ncbi:MAG: hypothetical protein M3Y17_00110 [Actinomycetota bacterium]|nr:hypothetical protein [Actinomycetota bacterium]
MAPRTKDAYDQHVVAYGAWLAGRREEGDPLSDPRARDYAARDFKRHLKVDGGWTGLGQLALAAVDQFNRFLGLGAASVKREPLAQAAPSALSEGQQRELLRAAEASRSRDRAIVTTTILGMAQVIRASESDSARRQAAAQRMRGLFADVAPERRLVDELLVERRAEAQAEDRTAPAGARPRGG